MTALAIGLFALSFALGGWSYLVYPALLRRLASRRSTSAEEGPPAEPPTFTVDVLVAAAEEEAVIADRIRDLLAQKTPFPVRIAIGCDGSTDGTAQVARAAGGDRVSVFEFPRRRGKASVLNELVAAPTADVLVFTDANTRFEEGAIRELCHALEPETVGAACGTLRLQTADSGGLPEEEFWDRETRLKQLEGALGLCLGANGAIYATKRAAVAPLPPDTTSMDDFLIPLGILRRGGKVVFVREAVAVEPAGRTVFAEAKRRFRIGVGAGQVLRRERWIWNVPRHPLLSVIFFSRKVARWLAPVLFVGGILASLASPILRVTVGAAVIAGLFLITVAASNLWRLGARRLARKPYYFAVINLSLAVGVAAGLFGYSRPAWKPSR